MRPGRGQRQHDLAQRREPRVAVDHGRVLVLGRDGPEVAVEHPDGERQLVRGVEQHEAGERVGEADQREERERRHRQRRQRDAHHGHDHEQHDPLAFELEARERIGGESGDQHAQRDGERRHDRAVEEVLVDAGAEELRVVLERRRGRQELRRILEDRLAGLSDVDSPHRIGNSATRTTPRPRRSTTPRERARRVAYAGRAQARAHAMATVRRSRNRRSSTAISTRLNIKHEHRERVRRAEPEVGEAHAVHRKPHRLRRVVRPAAGQHERERQHVDEVDREPDERDQDRHAQQAAG